jgi:hypothetical protein
LVPVDLHQLIGDQLHRHTRRQNGGYRGADIITATNATYEINLAE